MKNVCRDINYCVQYNRDDTGCPIIDIDDCSKFDEKLREFRKHCNAWQRNRIDEYFMTGK
jgi:hypothetical protein